MKKKKETCKDCGACKTCGSKPAVVIYPTPLPVVVYPRVYPSYPQYPYITYGSGGSGSYTINSTSNVMGALNG